MTRSVFALLLASSALFAQGDARRIVQSGTITMPGNYMLTTEITGELVIAASDVTLNLNGFGINGPGGKQGMGLAIRNARGVKVTGGSISNFAFGVVVENSSNVLLRDLRIRAQGLTVVAPPPETGIMIVQSSNVVVENNALYNVGLGIFVRGGRSYGNRIANNTVTAGTNGVFGICYNPAPNDNNGPRGDLIYNNLISRFATAIALSDLSVANVMKGNTLAFFGMAVDFEDPSNIDMENAKVKLP